MTQDLGELQTTSLRCDVATDFRAVQPFQEQWDALALKLAAPVCMTFDWLRTWWEHYGDQNRLRLFLFWRDRQLVSVAPIYLESFGMGCLKTTVARIVGANLPPRRFDPPIDVASAVEVFGEVHRRLFVVDGCDLLSFGPVSQAWPALEALKASVGMSGNGVVAGADGAADVDTVFTLSAEFSRKLESKHVAKRYLRELDKHGGITTDVVSEPGEIERCFDAFAKQHAEQWGIVGKGGHFVAWPQAYEFHQALVKRQGELGRVRFYRILADGEMIACCYGYIFGPTLSWEMPSRVVGVEWDKVGLGKAAFIRMCQSAVGAGVLIVHAGIGRYGYKVNLGASEAPVQTFRLVGGRWSSRARTAAFLAMGRILRILCHKIWYRRIVPRMPKWIRRSQSRYWLRFDA